MAEVEAGRLRYSAATQRYGSIRFVLAAHSDSARGDVLMLTERPARALGGDAPTASGTGHEGKALSIQFVMARGDTVVGVMDPYQDPDGATLLTRFTGVLKGDRIQGGYVTRNLANSETTTGEWMVRRKP